MIIKQPFVPDVSSYNQKIVWSAVRGAAAVIVRTSDGLLKDTQFGNNWTQLAGKLPRAAYHFYRWWLSNSANANVMVGMIRQYDGLGPGDKVFLDCETSLMSIGAIVGTMQAIEQALGIRCDIYSRKNILDPFSFAKLTQAQKDYLRSRNIWTAGYPLNPDLFDLPPSAYVPDPTRYGKVVLWQYTDATRYPGIPGVTDTNWVDPTFLAQWVAETFPTTPPPPPPPSGDIGSILIRTVSAADVQLQTVTVDGVDETAVSSLLNTIVEPAPEPPPVPPPPAPGLNLYRVLWMFQRPVDLRPPVVFQKPDVLPGRQESMTDLTSELQHYWFDLLKQTAPAVFTSDQLVQAWRSLTASDRAYTNNTGTDLYRDYISGKNAGQKDAKMDKFRACGGNVVNVLLGSDGKPITQNVLGIPCYRVQALDPASHPTAATINYRTTPWLVHLATNGFSETNVGGFPQLAGNDVQVPLFGIGGWNLLPIACLEKITGGIPSPYLPAR